MYLTVDSLIGINNIITNSTQFELTTSDSWFTSQILISQSNIVQVQWYYSQHTKNHMCKPDHVKKMINHMLQSRHVIMCMTFLPKYFNAIFLFSNLDNQKYDG